MFDEEIQGQRARHRQSCSTAPGLILAAGDNVGASPANSALLEDKPAIDVENAWGLDATSYGNHEFDYGVQQLLMQQERANFPFLDEHRRRGDEPASTLGHALQSCSR